MNFSHRVATSEKPVIGAQTILSFLGQNKTILGLFFDHFVRIFPKASRKPLFTCGLTEKTRKSNGFDMPRRQLVNLLISPSFSPRLTNRQRPNSSYAGKIKIVHRNIPTSARHINFTTEFIEKFPFHLSLQAFQIFRLCCSAKISLGLKYKLMARGFFGLLNKKLTSSFLVHAVRDLLWLELVFSELVMLEPLRRPVWRRTGIQ
ncbi:hypothetical protein [Cohaesibacter sp. CAU 1516]|uniref:hypothetical protein n=1 Tax=Cohaesibacter sp. CAU 1516 TaxID=2576038 RepID=UPI001484CBC1|nr:hypothetical protein [Cohaesibacter sp. CAU 1516]